MIAASGNCRTIHTIAGRDDNSSNLLESLILCDTGDNVDITPEQRSCSFIDKVVEGDTTPLHSYIIDIREALYITHAPISMPL